MTDTRPDDVDDVFAALRDSFAQVRMDLPVESVIAAGQLRRRRRRLLAGGALSAVVMAGAAATMVAGLPNDTDEAQPTRPDTSVHVHLAAWSVDSSGDGAVTVDVRELSDAARLETTLAAAGVPAIVNADPRCAAVGGNHLPELGESLTHRVVQGGAVVMTIKPSAMPAGSKLVFDVGGAGAHDIVPPGTAGPAPVPAVTAAFWLAHQAPR